MKLNNYILVFFLVFISNKIYSEPVITLFNENSKINCGLNLLNCDGQSSMHNFNQIIWYADFDNDGFGDPNDTILSSSSPSPFYITNCYFDECPQISGTRNGCPINEYDFNNINQNYVYERVYLREFEPEELANATNFDVIEQITYTDGLGRPKQQNSIKSSPVGKDIIQHHEYDGNGIKTKSYLPYVSSQNGGNYDVNSQANTISYYDSEQHGNTTNPYTEIKNENSPYNRVLEQGFPGNDWKIIANSDAGHTIKYEYRSNSLSDYIRNFGVSFINNNIQDPQLEDWGIYTAGVLKKTITKNENWRVNQPYSNQDNTIEHYRDMEGRDILKREFNQGKWHDTYYVYDSFGNLTFVLPPKIHTYSTVEQQYLNYEIGYFENVISLYDSSLSEYENELYFNVDENGLLRFDFYEYGEPGVPFEDGMVLELNFDPPLPDMVLGQISVLNSSGYWEHGADASIVNGNLYFYSEGIDVYGAQAYLTIDLSNYLSNFVNDVSVNELEEYAYQYHYDERHRIIEKKTPGKGWEFIIYDKLNRPVLTQDANQRLNNDWLGIKYDMFNRVILTGSVKDSNFQALTREELQVLVNSQSVYNELTTTTTSQINGGTFYYTNNVLQLSGSINWTDLYTVNYYDAYNAELTSLVSFPTNVFGAATTSHTKLLPTGSKVRVLDTDDWIYNVVYYDDESRPIYSFSKNEYLNTKDVIKNEYDFVGKILKTEKTHAKVDHAEIRTTNFFTYDRLGRLLTQKQQIGSGSLELIAKNAYDELGRLIKKDVGNTENAPLQQIDFTYNVRGWLEDINKPDNLSDDLFAIGIDYSQPDGPSSSINTPLYNGNISHVMWKSDNVDNGLRHYSYRYDALNRLRYAYYAENHLFINKYNENIHGYDRNSNILGLYRSSINPNNHNVGIGVDYLEYSYVGNKLMAVSDLYNTLSSGAEGFYDGNSTGNDYEYDPNGSMILDKNKPNEVGVVYNHLNLPKKISVDYDAEGYIEYVYSAIGSKVAKKLVSVDNYNIPIITSYAGNYIYEKVGSSGEALKLFSHSEGYVEPNSQGGFNYVYHYKDHLGNVRLSYKDMNGDNVITGATTEIFFEDFETANGWDSEGAMYGSALSYGGEHKRSGNMAGKFYNSTSTGNYIHSNEWIAINNSQPTDYIISGWIYSNGPGARFLLFMNEDGETDYATLVDETPTTTSRNRWVYLEKRVTVPINIDKINFRVDAFYGYSGTVWYDNLSIRRVNDINDIEIITENNYYPFGMRHKGYNDGISANVNNVADKFKFNGVELEDAFNLNLYEMDMRQYDPAIARWTSMDPVTHFSMSPYVAFDNNPVYWSDPSGANSEDYRDSSDPPGDVSEYEYDMNNPDDVNFLRQYLETLGWDLNALDEIILFGGRKDEDNGDYEYDFEDWFYELDIDLDQGLDGSDYGPSWRDVSSRSQDVIRGIDYRQQHLSASYRTSYGTTTTSATQLTSQARAWHSTIAKNAKVLGIGVTVITGTIDVANGIQTDGGKFGPNAQFALGGAVGGMAGAWAGAEAGAVVGAAIGVWFGGVGAAPGALIGGFIGGIVGGYAGTKAGETSIDYYYKED